MIHVVIVSFSGAFICAQVLHTQVRCPSKRALKSFAEVWFRVKEYHCGLSVCHGVSDCGFVIAICGSGKIRQDKLEDIPAFFDLVIGPSILSKDVNGFPIRRIDLGVFDEYIPDDLGNVLGQGDYAVRRSRYVNVGKSNSIRANSFSLLGVLILFSAGYKNTQSKY